MNRLRRPAFCGRAGTEVLFALLHPQGHQPCMYHDAPPAGIPAGGAIVFCGVPLPRKRPPGSAFSPVAFSRRVCYTDSGFSQNKRRYRI